MDTYKITISKVTRVEVKETEEMFFSLTDNSKKPLNWSGYYSLPDEEKENWESKPVPTGEIKFKESEQKLYEQEKDDLDIGEISMFINRAR